MWEKALLFVSDAAHKGGAFMGVVLAVMEEHAALVSIGIAVLGYLTRTYFDWRKSKFEEAEHIARMKKGGL